MKERPILFSGPMVRALLAGTKTQTRRTLTDLLKHGKITEFGKSDTRGYDWHFRGRQALWNDLRHEQLLERCPYGQPGDQLWVRESHRMTDCECPEACRRPGQVWYEATMDGYENVSLNKLRPSIHMPRWASRITLEITSVGVERLQEISEGDAKAEGCEPLTMADGGWVPLSGTDWIGGYRKLWNSINGPGSWDASPWVWVVEFKRITP